jgi:hypothetical protein
MSSVNWNSENFVLLAIAAAHLAVPCISYMRNWSVAPLLWTLRIDLLVMCSYALYRVYVLHGLGHAITDIDMLYYAIAEALLLLITLLPLPVWLVWTVYSLLMLLLVIITIFFLFMFKMRLF